MVFAVEAAVEEALGEAAEAAEEETGCDTINVVYEISIMPYAQTKFYL